MSRSLWKPLYNNKKNLSLEKNFIFKIYNRHQVITPDFLNLTVKIHNGIKFFEVFITEKMLYHKFGEFSPTRKYPLHKKKKNILKKK